jgi:hypothetical protein
VQSAIKTLERRIPSYEAVEIVTIETHLIEDGDEDDRMLFSDLPNY